MPHADKHHAAAAGYGARFGKVIDAFVENIMALGPSPLRSGSKDIAKGTHAEDAPGRAQEAASA